MHCKFCGFNNDADDHRCHRCGRRLGIAVAAPAGYSGANALAVAPALDPNALEALEPLADTGARQSTLFKAPGPKVIQFPAPAGKAMSLPSSAASPAVKKKEPPKQAALDFLDIAPVQRTLRNAVPAQIYCEQTVAGPMHRFVASAVDAAIIMLGFGLFVCITQLLGSSFGEGKQFWIMAGVAFALVSIFYGLIFAIAGRETAGMRSAGLQLITFDGLPVEGPARAVRVASTCLSFCSGGLGLIWAMADEENLTWHDHISKTFPAVAEPLGGALRRGR